MGEDSCDKFLKEKYLLRLKSKVDKLEPIRALWKNLDVKVEDVYIPLSLENHGNIDFRKWIVEDAKDKAGILIWGEIGSGKSTLIQDTILALLKDFEKNKIIPIFLSAKNWNRHERFEDFLKSELKNLDIENVDSAFSVLFEKCRNYRIFLFIDGLDELPEGFTVSEAGQKFWESNLKDKFEKVIVTARERSHGNMFFQGDYYSIYLEPFSKDLSEELFKKWKKVFLRAGISPDKSSLLERVRRILLEDEILSGLSRNPLILVISMIWFLTAVVDIEKSIGNLMDDWVAKLFTTWDKIRGIKVERQFRIEKYFETFEHLALQELNGEKSEGFRIDEFLAKELKRRGVFVRFEHGKFTFINPLFRNYFAARYLSKEPANYTRHFAKKLFDQRWYEPFVITFYLLLESSYDAAQFLILLLETFNPFDDIFFFRFRIALRCLNFLLRNQREYASDLRERTNFAFQEVYEKLSNFWKDRFETMQLQSENLENVYQNLKQLHGEICPCMGHDKEDTKNQKFRKAKVVIGRGGRVEPETVYISVNDLRDLLLELLSERIMRDKIKKKEKWKELYAEETKFIRFREKEIKKEEISEIFEIASRPLDCIVNAGKRIAKTKEREVESLKEKIRKCEEDVREVNALFAKIFGNYPHLLPDRFLDKIFEAMAYAENQDIFENFIEDLKLVGPKGAQILVSSLKSKLENSLGLSGLELQLLTMPEFLEKKEWRGLIEKWKGQDNIPEILKWNLSYSYSRPTSVVIFDFLFAILEKLRSNLSKELLEAKKELSKVLCNVLFICRDFEGVRHA